VRFFGVSKPSSVRSARGSKNKHEHARFEVLTAVLLKIQAFWDVTPRELTALPWGWTHYDPSKRRGIYQSTRCNILEDWNLQKLRDVFLLLCSWTYWYRCSVRHSLRNKKRKPYTRPSPARLSTCPDISDRNILSDFLAIWRGNSLNKTCSNQGRVPRKSADWQPCFI
jgi:hypothetical protein